MPSGSARGSEDFLYHGEAYDNHREPGHAAETQRILTARAASNTTMVKEIIAWSIMSSLAHLESTGASVGDRAVLVLKARNR